MYDPRDQCNSGVVQAQAFCETLMLHGLNDRGLQSGREFISDPVEKLVFDGLSTTANQFGDQSVQNFHRHQRHFFCAEGLGVGTDPELHRESLQR